MPRQAEPPYEVRHSPIHGYGVFATRRIRPGQRIAEYIGEIIDGDEAAARYPDDDMPRHHTFLFGRDDGSYIDAGVGGSASRYINHSCAPNCESEEVDGRIYVYALQNIQPGTELCYDYKLERPGRPRKSWKVMYACHCGAPNCRGTMLQGR